ncbi:nitroreductase family protein [Deferribacteres bacterium DY0037]
MDFLELAKDRYSVRKFSERKVEQEKIDSILEAGRLAPTAVNYQPQRILVISSDESLDKFRDCTPYHFNAPLALLVCYDSEVSWKRSFDNKDMGEVDASIVATQMMLEVTNLGLGSTWVGHFDPEKIRNAFKIPANIVPVALFPVGYPAESSKPSPKHSSRLAITETVFMNSF